MSKALTLYHCPKHGRLNEQGDVFFKGNHLQPSAERYCHKCYRNGDGAYVEVDPCAYVPQADLDSLRADAVPREVAEALHERVRGIRDDLAHTPDTPERRLVFDAIVRALDPALKSYREAVPE